MPDTSVIEIILRVRNEMSAGIAAATRDVQALADKVRGVSSSGATPQAGFKGDWYSADFQKFEAGLKTTNTSVQAIGKSAGLTRQELSFMMQAGGVPPALTSMVGAIGTMGAAVAGIGATAMLAKTAIELGTLGQQVEQTERKFVAFTGGPQQAAAALAAMRTATEGGLSAMDAMTYSAMLLSMGLAKNGEDAARVTRLATMLGPAYRDAAANIQDFTMLLANQSIRRLDQFGLSIDAVKTKQAEFVASGMDTQLAFTNAVLEIGTQKMELLAGAGVKATTSAGKLTAAWTDMRNEIGKDLAPQVGGIQAALADLLNLRAAQVQAQSPIADQRRAGLERELALRQPALAYNQAILKDDPRNADALLRLALLESRITEINRLIADLPPISYRVEFSGDVGANLENKIRGAVEKDYTVHISADVADAGDVGANLANRLRGANAYSGGYTNAVLYEQARQAFANMTVPGGQTPKFDFSKATPEQGLAYLKSYDKLAEAAILNLTSYRETATSADLDFQTKTAKEAEAAWKLAAAATERSWQLAASTLLSIPGLGGGGATSPVTPAQMAAAKVGLYQNMPDEKLRQLEDATLNPENRKKYPGLIEQMFGAAGVGFLAGGNLDQLKAGFEITKAKWASGELFANEANLGLIDKGAADREIKRKADEALGQKNVLGMFGVPAAGMTGQTDMIAALDRLTQRLPAVVPLVPVVPGAKPAAPGALTAPPTTQIAAQTINVTVAPGAVLIGGETTTAAEERLKDWIVDAFKGFAQAEQRRAPTAPAMLPGNPQ